MSAGERHEYVHPARVTPATTRWGVYLTVDELERTADELEQLPFSLERQVRIQRFRGIAQRARGEVPRC